MRELLIFSNRWCCYNETIDRELKSVYSSHLVSDFFFLSLKRRLAVDTGPGRGSNLQRMLWQVSLYSEEIKWKREEWWAGIAIFGGGGVLCLFCLGSLKGAETQEMDPDWVHSCNCWWANCSLSLSPIHLHFLPITENYLCSQLDMRVNPFWLSWQYCEQIPNCRVKKPEQACSKAVSSSMTVSLVHKNFSIS